MLNVFKTFKKIFKPNSDSTAAVTNMKLKASFIEYCDASRTNNKRCLNTLSDYSTGAPLILIKNLIDKVDIRHLQLLTEHVKKHVPSQFEDRLFDKSPVDYNAGELVIDNSDINNTSGIPLSSLYSAQCPLIL